LFSIADGLFRTTGGLIASAEGFSRTKDVFVRGVVPDSVEI